MEVHEEVGASFRHLIAGAVAGTVEHCGMYPIDTIKTHVQAHSNENGYKSPLQVTRQMFRERGVLGFFRGMTAVAAGAAPAHAIYFASYEFFKERFGGNKSTLGHNPIPTGTAGVIATLLSDAVLVPMDAVKQKRQLSIKQYRGTIDCIRTVLRVEGVRALYAGYTTTLTMNVPYNFLYFATYESLRKIFKTSSEFDPVAHIFAGGGAGVAAAGLTNPLDVAKTRLQTQGDVGKTYKGMIDAMKTIWREEGARGYTRGIGPRMLFHSMSAGLCWSAYEYMKYVLGIYQRSP